MIRKQVYLTPQIDRELEIVARQEGKSVAEVVRDILEKGLKVKDAKKENPAAVLFKISGIAKKGPKDLSTNLFDYLYGKKSPNYDKRKKNTR